MIQDTRAEEASPVEGGPHRGIVKSRRRSRQPVCGVEGTGSRIAGVVPAMSAQARGAARRRRPRAGRSFIGSGLNRPRPRTRGILRGGAIDPCVGEPAEEPDACALLESSSSGSSIRSRRRSISFGMTRSLSISPAPGSSASVQKRVSRNCSHEDPSRRVARSPSTHRECLLSRCSCGSEPNRPFWSGTISRPRSASPKPLSRQEAVQLVQATRRVSLFELSLQRVHRSRRPRRGQRDRVRPSSLRVR